MTTREWAEMAQEAAFKYFGDMGRDDAEFVAGFKCGANCAIEKALKIFPLYTDQEDVGQSIRDIYDAIQKLKGEEK